MAIGLGFMAALIVWQFDDRASASLRSPRVNGDRSMLTGELAGNDQNDVADAASWPDRLLGLEITLPSSGWTAVREPMDLGKGGRIITLNNFRSQYLHGGLLPAKGAEIQIVADATSARLRSVADLAREFLSGDKHISTGEIRLTHVSCNASKIESLSEFAPGTTYRTFAVFLPVTQQLKVAGSGTGIKRAVVYKFFLTYRVDESDTNQRLFQDTFSQLMNSAMTITPVECAPPPARQT